MAGSQTSPILPICDVNQTAISTTFAGDEWTIQYSRFFNYPFPPLTISPHPCITISNRRGGNKGTWLSTSSSSTASLTLIADHSRSDSVITVSYRQKVLEEHYISKLQFTWPQMSCLSGYPPRGSRVIFVSYRDHLSQVQKFALRFLTTFESERFAKFLKESLEDGTANVLPCNDVRSELSSQSEFIPSDKHAYRPCLDWSPKTFSCTSEQMLAKTLTNEECLDDTTTVIPRSNPRSELSSQTEFVSSDEVPYRPIQDWSPVASSGTSVQKMASSLNLEISHNSASQEIAPSQDVRSNISALPPSFTSLLMNCRPVPEQGVAKPIASLEAADLKMEIAKYMEDSSFQDMLSKVQRVIDEIGDDLLL